MNDADTIIRRFELQPHPEGGHFREMHRAKHRIHSPRHDASRNAYTSIYFLLPPGEYSAWHRITSDETWFHHAGGDVMILWFDPAGALRTSTLGMQAGHMQFTIPAGTWFAARPVDPEAYSFVSCVVGPGFEFADFELATREGLQAQYGKTPENLAAIARYCR